MGSCTCSVHSSDGVPSGTPWMLWPMDIPRFGIPEKLADRMSMAEQHAYLRARLTRRRVLRTSVATAAVAGTGLASGLASPPAYAAAPDAVTSRAGAAHVDGSLVAPFGRHLAYGADARTQMTVSWQVPFAVKRPYIRIGLKPWGAQPQDRRGSTAPDDASARRRQDRGRRAVLRPRGPGAAEARHDVLLRRRPRRVRPRRRPQPRHARHPHHRSRARGVLHLHGLRRPGRQLPRARPTTS